MMLLALPLFSFSHHPVWFVLSGSVLVIIGIIDDLRQLSASFKLLVQLLATVIDVIDGGAIFTNEEPADYLLYSTLTSGALVDFLLFNWLHCRLLLYLQLYI